MKPAHAADIVVVGAGIAGISVSSLLSEHYNVVLLECEDRPTFHATSRSAALLIENYGGDVTEQFVRGSRPFLESPPVEFSDSGFLKTRGVLTLVGAGREENFKQMCDSYSGIRIFSPGDLAQTYPAIRADKLVGGVLEVHAMDLDVDRLCQSYLRQFRANGGLILCGAGVTSLERHNGQWNVQTKTQTYSTPLVINAAGGWADQVATMAGIKPLGLTACRRSVAVVEFSLRPEPDWPMMMDDAETWFAKPQGNAMMVSRADETPVEACDIWPEDIDIATGIDNFQQAVDMGEVKKLVHAWAGLRTFAPDRHPVLGFDRDSEGFFWLAGQGGSGIHAGPALAEAARAIICGRELPAWLRLSDEVIESLSPKRLR